MQVNICQPLMPKFSNVFIGPAVRASLHKVVQPREHKKFWSLVCRLKEGSFEIPGLNVEKLHGKTSKIYSARMSKEMRLIFSIRNDSDRESSLIIHELNHHDQAYTRAERSSLSENKLENANELIWQNLSVENELEESNELELELELEIESDNTKGEGQLFRVPYYLLSDPGKYLQFEKTLDRYLLLSEEQEDILSVKDRAFLVQGPAGSGKTTLALFAALNFYEQNTEDSIYLFTYHEELACVCRAYTVNLLGEDKDDTKSGIRVFSYIDFCRRHLRHYLEEKDRTKRLIARTESVQLLSQILSQKSRWERQYDPEKLFGLFYSILKGRFMPGTEKLPACKEDYERIFRDYGRTPDSFEDNLEIFSLYQQKLVRNRMLDEADIIRLSYESLKKNALLAESEQRLFIVIDEVQDFTELEWKSILLFWENHCKHHKGVPGFPFLSGDTNQNISKSGFRWQELESYLQSILSKLHRPRSLSKITLHKNYRNTLQIHQLAVFIRKFASELSDLGLAPDLVGQRPAFVVADESELVSFLKKHGNNRTQENPLVVLVEAEESLNRMRKELSDCSSVFLLSLANSKGMEFEDVIIHRAFSSCSGAGNNKTNSEASRLFDLWYMGISRARKNLLLFLNNNDAKALKELLSERFDEFINLVDIKDAEEALESFWASREQEVPNYNVIFLERKIAEDLFNQYLKEKSNTTDNQDLSGYAQTCKERALSLWRRCHDYGSLGKALMELKQYEEAAGFLDRSGYIYESANCYEANGQYLLAAEQYETLEFYEDAARSYHAAENFLKAGILYEKTGNWAKAAEAFADALELDRAAINWEKAASPKKAADIYQSRDKWQKAAELYLQAEDYLNAAQMYLRLENKLDAASSFQKAGQYKKALELYESLNCWSEAAEAAKEAALHKRAADLYAKLKDFSQAALAYERAGRLDSAALMYEKAGLWSKALELSEHSSDILLKARIKEKMGEFQTAAELFLKAGAIAEAAYSLEKAQEFEQAADLFLKSKLLVQAAACFARIDRNMDAAKLYVVSGLCNAAYELVVSAKTSKASHSDESGLKQLIEWCLENKKLGPAAQLLELNKDYPAAAAYFKECLMLDKAAHCLEKCGKFSEAGGIYQEAGNWQKAADCYRNAKEWEQAGLCLEKLQNWAEAKTMYERSGNNEGVSRCKNALNWF